MTAVMLDLVEETSGDAGVEALLHVAGSTRTRRFLETSENWITIDETVALLAAAVEVTGDADAPQRIGARTVQRHAGTALSTAFRSLGSPEAILQAVTTTSSKFSTVTEMESLENGPGRCVVRAVARPGFERPLLLCQWARGVLSTGPILFGLPPGIVEEESCQARGDAECRYVVTWDPELATAGADPHLRVTALEAQLIDTQARLRSVFSTASELLSVEDLDVVLARIVERAAQTVRAPQFVLAVRVGEEDRMRIYCDGLSRDQAEVIAEALQSGLGLGDGALVGEVASGRRAYGWLCALYPPGNDSDAFLPQEQELFSLYVTYAAAVLDMATALTESARRHGEVSALLSLSQDLTRQGGEVDIADGLAAAIPGMIDCDQSDIWLWDEVASRLRAVSTSGTSAARARTLGDHSVDPDDSPCLAAIRARPEVLSFTSCGVDDAFLRTVFEALEVAVLVVVPIVARGEFLGVLTASVAREPERLASSAGLRDRLLGISALAAPAILNARLIQKLSHQASHDALTGLANRSGFGSRLSALLDESQSDRRLGLLYIDLDAFKAVNDVNGHDVGDALLKQVALRLSNVVREADTVARLGGDEFAVILADVASVEEVATAAARVRDTFTSPFAIGDVVLKVGASVGQAGWPIDGVDVEALLRHADTAMYEQKTRAPARGVHR